MRSNELERGSTTRRCSRHLVALRRYGRGNISTAAASSSRCIRTLLFSARAIRGRQLAHASKEASMRERRYEILAAFRDKPYYLCHHYMAARKHAGEVV